MTSALPFQRISGRFWRMLAPRWAHDPLSGAGSAKHGGRFNAKGVPALYMSADFTTAIAEYEQELGIRPGTLCAYDVDMPGIVDLADAEVLRELDISQNELATPWKQALLIDRQTPVTWGIAERLQSAGANGIRIPSVQAAGNNLVLWDWDTTPEQRVAAHDPMGDLPKDQASWS